MSNIEAAVLQAIVAVHYRCGNFVERPRGPVGCCNEGTMAGKGATYSGVIAVWTSCKLETTLRHHQVW